MARIPDQRPDQRAASFEMAAAHFRAGRMGKAESLFKALAAKNYRAGLCCHFLALIEQGRGRLRKALELYDRSVAADPSDASVYTNRGNLLVEMGEREAALASFDRAVTLRPDSAEALCNRGNVLQALGRPAEARAAYAEALRVRPDFAQAWDNQGNLLAAQGEELVALASFEKALELAPGNPMTHYNRANALQVLGRYAEALAGHDRALALRPDWDEALNNRANALRALNRDEAALVGYDRVLAVRADHAGARKNRAELNRTLRRHEAALADYDKVLAAHPADAEALAGRGNVLLDMGRLDEALAAFEAAIGLAAPDDTVHSVARYGRAMVRLLRHDFAGGWDDYEERWGYLAHMAAATPTGEFLHRPTPADVAGRDVVVLREQGIGDEVMFASALPDLLGDARHVTYAGDLRLVRLFQASLPGLVAVAEAGFDRSAHAGAAVLAVGSLGYLYRRAPEAFPGTPYLRPRDAVATSWAARLGERTGRLRIGLSWRGGIRQTRQTERSLTLDALRPVLALPGCEFVSLQYGEVADEVAGFPELRVFPRAEIDDFEDLAGLMLGLDLVVSVQNTNVHLAGALGVPCMALVPGNPEWRYGASDNSMPWYRSVRLFRQARGAGWDDAIAAVTADVVRRRDA